MVNMRNTYFLGLGVKEPIMEFQAGHDGTSIAWEWGESGGSMLFRTESTLKNMVQFFLTKSKVQHMLWIFNFCEKQLSQYE